MKTRIFHFCCLLLLTSAQRQTIVPATHPGRTMTRNRVILLCLIFLIFGFALDPAINAQIVYDLPGIRESSVALADFNYDGIPDLAAVTPCMTYGHGCNEALVSFYTGDGTGQFTVSATANLGVPVTGPSVAADFYGNGKVELIVPYSRGLAIIDSMGSVSWYPLTVYAYISAVQFADLDGDGKLDMLVLSNWELESYRGNGAGNFTRIGSYGGEDQEGFLLGDFNGDGKIDVAAPTLFYEGEGVNLFLGNGDGTFQTPIRTDGPYYSPTAAAADFNHDGKLDLAIGIRESSRLDVLLGKGDGTFFPPLGYNTGQWHSAMVVAGDFDADGNPDLAVADGCWDRWWPCSTDGAITILLGNGDGTFQLPTSYSAGGRVETNYSWH